MSGVCYKLFGTQYFESQGKMMARVFETLLRRHPEMVPDAIEEFTCLSATDYTKDLEALRSAPLTFQNKTTCLIEGQTVCIATSVGMPQKKSFISRLFRLCGEDEGQFQIIGQDDMPENARNAAAQRKKGAFRAAEIGYTLFGEHIFSTQADMMCRVFERVFQVKPQMVDWAVSNLKCLSWTDYSVRDRNGEPPPYNFKNCRVITAGDRRLCVGTSYGIKAKSAFLDRLIRQAGLPEDTFHLDIAKSLPKLSWWQLEAVQAILRRVPQSFEDDKHMGIVSMPTGSGKTLVMGEFIRRLFQNKNRPWSVLILTGRTSLSLQYQERLKEFLDPSCVVTRPARTSELPALVGIPGTVLCTTSQSFLDRSRTGDYFPPDKAAAEPVSASEHLLVIMDEIAVGFVSRISRDIHARLPNAAYLGFTCAASPSKYLTEAFGSLIYQYTYESAVEDGVLSPVYYEQALLEESGADHFSHPEHTKYFLLSEERLKQIAGLISARERDFKRRVLVLCMSLEEMMELYGFLAPVFGGHRLRLRCVSIPERVRDTMPVPPASWDGRSFSGCVVLSCTVTTAFPPFDVVYLDRKVRSSFDATCVLSVLMRQGAKRQASGRLVDLYHDSSLIRWMPSASVILPPGDDEPSASFESYMKQIEDALELRKFELAQEVVLQLREAFPSAGGAVSEELAFLEPPAGQSASLYRRQHADALAWYGDLWRLLRREIVPSPYQEEDLPEPEEAREEPYPAAEPTGSPQARGARLEQAVKELIRQVFSIPEEGNQNCLEELRLQGAGYQFGFDVAFTYRDAHGNMVDCVVECKNYQGHEIKLNDVAGKLVGANALGKKIDHWLVISPNGKVSNELWILQKQWRESGKWYPILDVQFWTADQAVGELFSLFPQLYQQFYAGSLERDPAGLSGEQFREILARWRNKLAPVPYLPPNWMRYLRDPGCLLVEQEADLNTIDRYEALYDCCVSMSLLDQNELPVDGTAEEYFLHWLRREDHDRALLLGDFGDGKTFFTYTLARRLARDFLASPEQGFIPLRISLQRLGEQPNNCRDVLDSRIREFGDGVRDWNEVQRRYRFLIILDGLDEMSQSMSDTAVLENLSILEELMEQFKGHRVLVTSRKMVIYSERIRRRMMTALGKPEILHLAPITPGDRIAFLQKMADTPDRRQRLTQIRQTHDLIGLAAKPLFLDMMRVQLDSGSVESMDSAGIYLYYAKEVLRRKQRQLALRGDATHPDDIQERLLELLEKLAVCLHRQGTESISLNHFKEQIGQNDLAEVLWDCADTAQAEDTDRRVSNRSLLKYDRGDRSKLCFCHRSMQEYFIARGAVRQLLEDEAAGRAVLLGPGFGYEILLFAGELLRALDDDGRAAAARRLTRFAHERPSAEERGSSSLAVNSVNLLHYSKLGLPGRDWSGLCLDNALLSGEDLSGKNFSHTSMRYAHLDNADLRECDLRYCDFTGVQFEKTGQLYAFGDLPGRDGLLGFYQDGNVRCWKFSNENVQTLAQMRCGKILRVFLEKGGREAVLDTKRLQFLRRGRQSLTVAGSVPLHPGTVVLDVGQETALVRQQGALLLLRLASGECLGRVQSSHAAFACLLRETEILLWSNDRGLEVYDMERESRLCQANVGSGAISALAAHMFSPTEGVVVLGSDLGDINSYRMVFNPAEGRYRIEHNGYASTGGIPVAQAVVDDSGLYVGLSTGKILLYRRDDQNGLKAGKAFHLEIKCSGAKLDGIIPPEQRLTLLHICLGGLS